jgi:hypothetical protein
MSSVFFNRRIREFYGVCVGDKTNSYRILIGKPEGMKDYLGELDIQAGG